MRFIIIIPKLYLPDPFSRTDMQYTVELWFRRITRGGWKAWDTRRHCNFSKIILEWELDRGKLRKRSTGCMRIHPFERQPPKFWWRSKKMIKTSFDKWFCFCPGTLKMETFAFVVTSRWVACDQEDKIRFLASPT